MSGAAQASFLVGASVYALAGGGHALLSLLDTLRPRWFAPLDPAVAAEMDRTGMRFRAPFPGDAARPTLWRCWLGFNVSHGLGALAFGLVCLLLALDDPDVVTRVALLRPLAIAVSAGYFLIALRYWFNGVQLMTAAATAAFALAAIL